MTLLALLLAVAACSDSVPDADPPAWTAPDPGLLRDARFDAADRGERPAWGFAQHSGADSYRFRSGDGMLEIERIGPEPWGQAVQRLDARPLAGQTLHFSAEIAGTFTEAEQRRVQATGLGVRVLGYRPGVPLIAGKHILVVADATPEIGPGEHGWTLQSVRFEVPEGATDIEVSVRLGMYGTLSLRGPSLVAIEAGSDATD